MVSPQTTMEFEKFGPNRKTRFNLTGVLKSHARLYRVLSRAPYNRPDYKRQRLSPGITSSPTLTFSTTYIYSIDLSIEVYPEGSNPATPLSCSLHSPDQTSLSSKSPLSRLDCRDGT